MAMVMAADIEGRWIVVEGFVDLDMSGDTYEGHLMTSEDADPLDHVRIDSPDGCDLRAILTPPTAKRYELRGSAHMGLTKSGAEVRSMILTDGTTVLGLALGPRSAK
jgi:hypothetical protein